MQSSRMKLRLRLVEVPKLCQDAIVEVVLVSETLEGSEQPKHGMNRSMGREHNIGITN